MKEFTPEPNFIEVGVNDPLTNYPVSPTTDSNIVPAPGGSVMAGGNLQSSNFNKGVSGWQIDATGSVEFNAGTFRGALVANSIDIPNTTTANSFHVNSSGDAWWGATLFASALASVSKAGAAIFTNIKITGVAAGSSIDGQYLTAASVASAAANLALRGWIQTSAFTVTDADTIAWGAGTFTASDGTAYSIGAGNTGNMVAKTYVYLDIAVSTTAYQITTTAATAVGNGKVMVAICQNATTEATFMLLNNNSYNIDAANIITGSITANEIAASTITGAKIATLDITGKSATFDTGTIGGFTMSATQLTATNFSVTSGAANTANLVVGTGANAGGLNSANAGSDITFWSGSTFANRATAPFRVDAAGNLTATSATLSGFVVSSIGTFGGNGSDGALSISSGTTTISAASANTLVKNYTTISITGTGVLAFSNPASDGTIIILKATGNVTLTSSNAAMIDVTGMGGIGGTAVTGANTNGNNGTQGIGVWFNTTSQGLKGTSGTGATGGAILTNKNLFAKTTTILLSKATYLAAGSGGGSGATGANDPGPGNTSGAGGRGGGALWIECAGALNFTTGGVSSAGLVGGNAIYTGGSGSGGGGAGSAGMILILYNTLTANSGTVNTIGGVGGTGTGTNSGGTGTGGGGGSGGGAYGGAGGSGGNSGNPNPVNGQAGTGTSAGGGGGGGGDGASANASTGGAAGASDGLLVTQNLYF